MAKKKAAKKGVPVAEQPNQGDTEAKKPAPQKTCPGCQKQHPTATGKCDDCGHEFPKGKKTKTKQTKGGSKKAEGMAGGDFGKRLEMGRQLIEIAGGLDETAALLEHIERMGGVHEAQNTVTLLKEEAAKMKSFAEKWNL